jgi:ferredoxin-nitrite reductase
MTTAIEEYKSGLSFETIWEKIMRYGREGWDQIEEQDIHALKWYGVFVRKQTPGCFMIRVRVPGGILESGGMRSEQLRVLADITRDYGKDIIDITTRQQIQLRWIRMEALPEVLAKLTAAGLSTMQTGFDNIRNVTTCPVAGLSADEAMDSRQLVKELNDSIVGNWVVANLPRKFNITVSGCCDNCTHGEINDVALMPAALNGTIGYNVWVGGALGAWGTQRSVSLNGFVAPHEAVELCHAILAVFNERGNREKRTKARLKFLLDEMGLDAFRAVVVDLLSFPLRPAGVELTREHSHRDHIGVHAQKTDGMHYVGLNVPTGRLKLDQAYELARLAEVYGSGELRMTTAQNVIIPHVSAEGLEPLLAEPVLEELPADPMPFMRGLISCTGNTFCPFAQIETKERTRELAQYLDASIGRKVMESVGVLEIHASGCPNSCGNPHTGQIGLIGKKVRVDGVMTEAADIYLGAEHGMLGSFNERWKTGIPFAQVGPVLKELLTDFIREREEWEPFRQWCIRAGHIKGELKDFAPMHKDENVPDLFKRASGMEPQ